MKSTSDHAQVATLCRQYCKSINVAASVRSKSYSGGNSVTIHLENIHPDIIKKIENHCGQYQAGHFNGMEDIYEYSNTNDGPQVKFIFVENAWSDEYYQLAWDWLRGISSEAQNLPKDFKQIPWDGQVFGQWANQLIGRILRGGDQLSDKFWAQQAKESNEAQPKKESNEAQPQKKIQLYPSRKFQGNARFYP